MREHLHHAVGMSHQAADHRVEVMRHRVSHTAMMQPEFERASKSLDALAESWVKAAETWPTDTWIGKSAKKLAVQPHHLCAARSDRIRDQLAVDPVQHPVFCRPLGITRPPRYEKRTIEERQEAHGYILPGTAAASNDRDGET